MKTLIITLILAASAAQANSNNNAKSGWGIEVPQPIEVCLAECRTVSVSEVYDKKERQKISERKEMCEKVCISK